MGGGKGAGRGRERAQRQRFPSPLVPSFAADPLPCPPSKKNKLWWLGAEGSPRLGEAGERWLWGTQKGATCGDAPTEGKPTRGCAHGGCPPGGAHLWVRPAGGVRGGAPTWEMLMGSSRGGHGCLGMPTGGCPRGGILGEAVEKEKGWGRLRTCGRGEKTLWADGEI